MSPHEDRGPRSRIRAAGSRLLPSIERAPMRKPEPIGSDWLILVPFDRREAISVAKAAEKAGKSESTVRSWCVDRGIGRRVADGPWQVSRIALQMLLNGDKTALCAYHKGDRTSPLVATYFQTLQSEH